MLLILLCIATSVAFTSVLSKRFSHLPPFTFNCVSAVLNALVSWIGVVALYYVAMISLPQYIPYAQPQLAVACFAVVMLQVFIARKKGNGQQAKPAESKPEEEKEKPAAASGSTKKKGKRRRR